mgnify:CR=1 FL=1
MHSMQLTVRALLGEEMRVHDKKIADLEKQMEKQRAEAKAETEKQELRIEQQRAEAKAEAEKLQLQIEQQQSQTEKLQLQIEQQRAEAEKAEKQRVEMEQRHSQGLRDQRQEFREALALVQQTVSDTQAGFAGKMARLSEPQCDVSIKMFDDVEGRVEGNERDSHSLQTRMGNLEWNLENLFKSFTSFQQQSDGRVGEVIVNHASLAKKHNKLASEHDGLHREVSERYADLQQELKMRAPLSTSGKVRAASSSRKRKRSGAFQGNATNATGEPITDEQRRELTAISVSYTHLTLPTKRIV